MKTYLIVGPETKIDINQLKSEYRQNKHSLKVIGDGENRIDCSAMDMPENAHVIINAHGINSDQHGHVIDLCIGDSSNTYLSTALAFKKIFSNNEPVNINLFSCFAGAAIKDIQALPMGSILTTHTAAENTSLLPIDEEVIFRLSKFNLLANNPFSVFIQTLLITPNENKFALRTKTGSEIFTSSVKDLGDYSVDGIKAWQQKELLSFTNFCRLHQKKSTALIKKKIDEFLKIVEDQSNNNWQAHDVKRYQELLLLNLADWNKAEDIQKLLDLKVNINSLAQDKSTPLYVASGKGNYASAKSLIDAGANINIVSILGSTPIWISSQNGHYKIVKLLINSGASVDIANEEGYTPLWKAAHNGNYKVAKLLIDAGANINTLCTKGSTPLMIAAQEGYYKVVKLLMDSGADINAMDITKVRTPLYQATQKGHYEIVKLLISAGANANIVNSEGNYPIHMASQNGFKEIVEVLIKAKVDINAKTLDGNTALLIALSKNNFPIAKLLIASGADVNAASIKGYTPLWLAAQEGYYEVAKLLISSGAEIDTFDIMKCTPLWMAAQNGHFRIAKLLIDAKANIEAMSKGNYTALHIAAQNGHYEVATLLIDEGANINAVDEAGYTALHNAVKNSFKDIAEMFIKIGMQVNSKTDKGITTLMLAAGTNTQEEYKEGYVAYNFAKSQAIKDVIKLYEKDPITYILKNNKQSQYAINALHNLKLSSLIEEKKDSFTKVEECLEFQMKFQDLNLNKLCGVDGSYYDDHDL